MAGQPSPTFDQVNREVSGPPMVTRWTVAWDKAARDLLRLSNFRFCRRDILPDTISAAFFRPRRTPASNSAPPEDGFAAIEMTPSRTVFPEFQAGVLAKAWLDEYSRPLTWPPLRAWLCGEAP